ncbi:RNA-binding protein [Burkholderia sp. WAC0059]|nr:RNA-binding protein [Burkholderia sp. WAC0059]
MAFPEGRVRIGGFGDSEPLSEALIALVRAGVKRGTCSLAWSWAFDGEAVPTVGDVEIVLDWHRRPVLALRITQVEIVPFDCVTAEFAASEGEGDLSLAYWQAEHWRFFTQECERIGRVADKSMPLVCERFELLHALAPTERSEYPRQG